MKRFTMTKIVLIATSLALTACVSHQTANQTPKVVTNNKGVPSHYQVQKGDTVSKIANRYGLNWREVAILNKLDERYTIRQGQWLTLWRPAKAQQPKEVTISTKPSIGASATPTPVAVSQPTPVATANPRPTTSVAATLSQMQQPQQVQPQPQPYRQQSGLVYPVARDSVIVRQFGAVNNNLKSEGIWFRGKEGSEIFSVADGRVAYVDESGVNGVFIHIRHNDGLMSEYRFVKNIKVEPNQTVYAGQPIASMRKGNTGAVVMEFRLSRHGAYVDPLTMFR